MALTQEEWNEMWNAIKKIDELDDFLHMELVYHEWKLKPPTKEIKLIKDKIQQVIGQME